MSKLTGYEAWVAGIPLPIIRNVFFDPGLLVDYVGNLPNASREFGRYLDFASNLHLSSCATYAIDYGSTENHMLCKIAF